MSLPIIFFATLIIIIAAGNTTERLCCARPWLTCYLIPTISNTLEGEPSNVRGGMSLSPYWHDGACFTRVSGIVSGLGGSEPHGIHIHERGDISVPDGTGTGGHYNPFGNDHALPNEGNRESFHVGDLGNLFPNETGVATFNTLYREPIDTWELVGRAIVIHAAEDLGRDSQPTGDAGARLATCVLGRLTT